MQAPGLFDVPDKRGKYGLIHNIGLGGAVVCSLLRRPEFYKEGGEDGRKRCGCSHPSFAGGHVADQECTSLCGFCDRLGYNHGHECRPITRQDVDKVKAQKNSPYILQLAKL